MLALTYLNPDREFSVTDMASHAGASVKTVAHEVERLVQTGLLTDRRMGTSRLVRSVRDSVLTRPLTDLLAVTYGPLPVLTDALSGVEGVEQAYIYGSWAARYMDEAGAVPGDVDVLVIGDADLDDLDELAREAETVLRREVNIRRLRRSAWETGQDAFVSTIRSRPLVELRLTRPTEHEEQRP
ncbi:ArsR family transcriptional regulator [Nocardioides sp. T2.26MG-1]|uniref:ArsR family transcriptional regulator n=1 Tax=Nocardioides sp. T2.26MG-1 TaxID=3041166 RepID=UPI002541E155|nr:ArsR family transcriptional regulator [Nocardioides sp. T2.26MG-1]